jgi:membrane-associated phospholipid phosphatase
MPLSYAIKDVLQGVLRRQCARSWIVEPAAPQWFGTGENFSGFPSGHMTVATCLVFVLCREYSRYRWAWIAALVGLGAALIGSDYHFVGDVTAGAYVGWLVGWPVDRLPAPWDGAHRSLEVSSVGG